MQWLRQLLTDFEKFSPFEATVNVQNEYNTSRHLLKTLLHYRVKLKSLKMLHLLYQFLMTKLWQTFMITLWIVNWFQKHILRIWNIASLLQWLLTRLAYCQRSKCPLASTQARRRSFHQLCYQMHSVKGRAKCPTVHQVCELVIGTRVAGQGSKQVSKVICF